MQNPQIEVYLNNELVTIAGIASKFGVVDDQRHSWFNQDLNIGDEITIKVSDQRQITPPAIKPKLTDDEILAGKLRYFHQLKEELKEHLG